MNLYGSRTVIYTALALEISELKVFGVNNGSNALAAGWTTLWHFRVQISTVKIYFLIK
jgi:hypothetical protein